MKKLSFILTGAALMMLAASCAKVNTPAEGGKTAVITVNVSSPELITRATGDGSQATDLYAAVYKSDGTELTDLRQHIAEASYPQQVQFSLVEGMSYKIAFLAQAKDAYLKEGTADLKAITLPAGKANDESLDLFTATHDITVKGNEAPSVRLTRPFARVNFVCTNDGIDAFKDSGLEVKLTQIIFSNLPETFNAVEGKVSGERKDVIYEETAPANEAFKEGYTTLAYAYLPVGKGQDYLTDAIFRVNGGARYLTVTNLPIKANYRTNVIGNLLTSSVNYSVTIDGTFTDDTEVEILAMEDIGGGVATDGKGHYTVDGTEGALAKALDAITADTENANPVITLTEDSAPLSYPARKTYGNDNTQTITIDGDGHDLNLLQTDSDWSSLGIKDKNGTLIIKNANVNKERGNGGNNAWNNHALIIKGDLTMENCTVNVSLAAKAWEGADKTTFPTVAKFSNVSFFESGAFYTAIITADAGSASFNNCTFTATNNGRGIKVMDQYIDEADRKQVNISVSGCKFTTASKGAILVTNTAGAKITWGEKNDISACAADNVNAVWNDEERKDAWDLVEVTGCTKKQE